MILMMENRMPKEIQKTQTSEANEKNIEKVLNAYDKQQHHHQDALAIQYLPAVRAMAFRLKERLPSSIDFNDLVSIGTEELIKLARRYESALNDSFWGYAKTRVNGAMLDYLRSLDVISRSNRKLIKSIDIEITKHLNEHGKEPSDAYLAEVLGENIEKIKEAKTASDIYALVPI
ncbi:sigma factor, partial [Helicobacter pylori]